MELHSVSFQATSAVETAILLQLAANSLCPVWRQLNILDDAMVVCLALIFQVCHFETIEQF
jgi:hypothetical protein